MRNDKSIHTSERGVGHSKATFVIFKIKAIIQSINLMCSRSSVEFGNIRQIVADVQRKLGVFGFNHHFAVEVDGHVFVAGTANDELRVFIDAVMRCDNGSYYIEVVVY